MFHEVHGVVVEQDEGRLQTGDHHVLVVARVSDDGAAVRVTRHVFEQSPALDPQLGRTLTACPRNGLVELRIREWPVAIDGVEVEPWIAGVGRVRGFGFPPEGRRLIEGQVMVNELANEGGACRLRQIVRVVGAQGGIDNQGNSRRLVASAQLVPGVQDAAGLADVSQGGLQGRRILTEEGVQVGEHTTESVLPDPNEPVALGLCHGGEETARSVRSHHRGADSAEEMPSTDRTRLLLMSFRHVLTFLPGSAIWTKFSSLSCC